MGAASLRDPLLGYSYGDFIMLDAMAGRCCPGSILNCFAAGNPALGAGFQ